MQLLWINGELGDVIIKALCWTLVHSLWQALLLAFAAAVIIPLTKKARPILQYNLLTGLLVVFLSMAVSTFIYQFHLASKTVTTTSSTFNLTTFLFNDPGITQDSHTHSWASRFISYCNNNAFTLFTIWFIVFFFKAMWTVAAFRRIEKIRQHRSVHPAPVWQEKVQQLAKRLNILQYIQMLESEVVKVPVVVGVFKPIILVPVGMLTNLPPDQVEMILLHELAHIKRKDYLVNVIQVIIETTFFFNPALLWISSLVREARENCCDDMAVNVNNDKKRYITALLSFQEYYSNQMQVAPAFASGRKNHLLNRVLRLVHNSNTTLNIREKFILTVALITAGFVGIAFSEKEQLVIKQLASKAVSTIMTVSTVQSAEAANEKKAVPETNRTEKKQDNATRPVVTANQPDNASIPPPSADTNIKDYRMNKVTLLKHPTLTHQKYTTRTVNLNNDSTILNKTPIRYKPPTAQLRKNLSDQILADLVNEQVITDTTGVAFSLTNEELVINGIKQPSDIHNRIISKYVKGPKDRLQVNRYPAHFY